MYTALSAIHKLLRIYKY